jgi:hypothetical protein
MTVYNTVSPTRIKLHHLVPEFYYLESSSTMIYGEMVGFSYYLRKKVEDGR